MLNVLLLVVLGVVLTWLVGNIVIRGLAGLFERDAANTRNEIYKKWFNGTKK